MRVHWSASLRDNLLPWHDLTGKQSYRSRLILFADYCFGPPTFVYRLFLLSCNKKINWKPSSGRSQEMKCSKRLIHKQFVQVSGLCGPQFLSYLPKRFMHLCRAVYGDAIFTVYRFGAPIWPPEINKNIWSSLFPWKLFLFTQDLAYVRINISPSTWNGYTQLLKIKRRDFFQRDSIPILASRTVKTRKFKLLYLRN